MSKSLRIDTQGKQHPRYWKFLLDDFDISPFVNRVDISLDVTQRPLITVSLVARQYEFPSEISGLISVYDDTTIREGE